MYFIWTAPEYIPEGLQVSLSEKSLHIYVYQSIVYNSQIKEIV